MKVRKDMSVHGNINRADLAGSEQQFGWVFTVFFAFVACLPLLHGGEVRWWALLAGSLFALVTLYKPAWLRPLNLVWHKFGLLLHHVVSPVVMGIMFFGAITPMGLLMKWRGKKLLALDYEPKSKSYWVKRDPAGPAPDTFKDQF